MFRIQFEKVRGPRPETRGGVQIYGFLMDLKGSGAGRCLPWLEKVSENVSRNISNPI